MSLPVLPEGYLYRIDLIGYCGYSTALHRVPSGAMLGIDDPYDQVYMVTIAHFEGGSDEAIEGLHCLYSKSLHGAAGAARGDYAEADKALAPIPVAQVSALVSALPDLYRANSITESLHVRRGQ